MKDYIDTGAKIGKLVSEKQMAYGDAIAKSESIIRALYPDGVKPEHYADFLLIVRIIDKMCRISNKNNSGLLSDMMGENPFMDIAGYGILGTSNKASE